MHNKPEPQVDVRHKVDVYIHDDPAKPGKLSATLAKALVRITNLEKANTVNQADLTKALTDLAATLDKVSGETAQLLKDVADLKDAVSNGGNTTPEVDAALVAVQERAKAIDDLVPDGGSVPAPDPVPPTP